MVTITKSMAERAKVIAKVFVADVLIASLQPHMGNNLVEYLSKDVEMSYDLYVKEVGETKTFEPCCVIRNNGKARRITGVLGLKHLYAYALAKFLVGTRYSFVPTTVEVPVSCDFMGLDGPELLLEVDENVVLVEFQKQLEENILGSYKTGMRIVGMSVACELFKMTSLLKRMAPTAERTVAGNEELKDDALGFLMGSDVMRMCKLDKVVIPRVKKVEVQV
jgi:hypothetical protein|nr:MAG TPA: hypothetical protein [Herelleviridae sp.]